MANRPPKKSEVAFPRRGDVYLVNFDPTLGSEIRKTRPALILQNDVANRYSPITIVAAITSRYDERLYPTEVEILSGEGGVTAPSAVLLNQVRSVDRRRLVRRLGHVTPATMQKVNQALLISFGIVRVYG
ncbi:MAG: type II toxin-antitoxin system PemK/MazF family toxin [Gemmatimonadaceae bacterium]